MTGTVMRHAVSPSTLIDLNYVIAGFYILGALLLAFAVYVVVDTYFETAAVPKFLYVMVWFGFALFLMGCGWHHIQHAEHLKVIGCAHSLCTTPAYISAWEQVIGGFTAIASSLLINRKLRIKIGTDHS